MLENSEWSVRGVRMGKSGPLERAELANQIQRFRILDRKDASEKNNICSFQGLMSIFERLSLSPANNFSSKYTLSL